MSGIFGSPKTPSFAAPAQVKVPAPTELDEAKLLEEEKKKIRRGRVSRATILTGPQGVLEPANVQRKTLLGQ